MLSLSRRVGQSLTIGDGYKVVVQEIHQGYVVLGIDAPRCVPVVRDDAVVKEPKKVEGKANG